MQKNQVNAIFVAQAKRKKNICRYILAIVIFIAILTYFLYLNFNKGKMQIVNYSQSSDVNYEVYLKENEFFENDYLEKDNQYIASLIKNIKADFKYNLSMEKADVDFDYSYKILAEVDVREKDSDNSIYKFQEVLLDKITKSSNGNSKIDINEQITVDYNHYNDLININPITIRKSSKRLIS